MTDVKTRNVLTKPMRSLLRQGGVVLLPLAVLLLGGFVSWWFAALQHRFETDRVREHVTARLDAIRGDLSRELFAGIFLTEGIVSLVKTSGDIDERMFDAMAAELLIHNPLVRNIALAPGNVVRYVYPRAGNESILGFDYMASADQRDAVLRAIETRRMIVAGPVNLVQGGVGIIGRAPIFVPDPSGKRGQSRYWGLFSTVVDFNGLLTAAGLDAPPSDMRIALRGRDGTGGRGGAFWGDDEVFQFRPIVMDVPLPSGSWQIAAIPAGGWPAFHPLASPYFLAGCALILILAALLFQVLRIAQARGREVERRTRTEVELRQANQALELTRNELEERVKERTRELLAAKEAAESADRLKSAFLATMSHELRTPLNSIIGFTGIILQGLAGPLTEEQRKQMGMVQTSAHHLLDLINDVLDISKIEAGEMRLAIQAFDVSRSVEKVAQAMRPLAVKGGLSLAVDMEPGRRLLCGDQRRVEQVLMNLVGNAIKFTERGGVSIHCRARETDMLIEVRDTGIGITGDDLGALFQPFRQIDTGLSRKHEGTGLGLSICKRLIDLMGGTIQARSEPGAGSVFAFTLPLEETSP